ncbi:MAG: rusticyanin [Thermoplasmatales archaeon B_DKE]|nr:MAG: rusticyanin [Thermoplasmatales archaeon B_DKE]
MNKYRATGLVSVLFLIAVVIFSAIYFSGGFGNSGRQNSGYLTESQLAAINVTSSGVYVSQANSTIFINGTTDLPILMGPMNAPSMYSFEILGIINPTLVIKQGSEVHFTVINVDTDSYHNFVLSHFGPPYAVMGSMMEGNSFLNSMQYLPPVHSGNYAYLNFSYTFSDSGTYWYLCNYPGHAENGMYGKIVVS